MLSVSITKQLPFLKLHSFLFLTEKQLNICMYSFTSDLNPLLNSNNTDKELSSSSFDYRPILHICENSPSTETRINCTELKAYRYMIMGNGTLDAKHRILCLTQVKFQECTKSCMLTT